jgi:hypothetical protein
MKFKELIFGMAVALPSLVNAADILSDRELFDASCKIVVEYKSFDQDEKIKSSNLLVINQKVVGDYALACISKDSCDNNPFDDSQKEKILEFSNKMEEELLYRDRTGYAITYIRMVNFACVETKKS